MTRLENSPTTQGTQSFVDHFRQSSPYIHAHRGQTFVILLSGETVAAPQFTHLAHDLALLGALGIRLVLVHGARPQIERQLQQAGQQSRYHGDFRITDEAALQCVKQAVGEVRVHIEGLLSMGLANTPTSRRLRICGGNYIIAKPAGVRDGVDLGFSGTIRRLDSDNLLRDLDQGRIVLVSPLGYSATGEVFNLNATDVAESLAAHLNADKMILFVDSAGVLDAQGQTITQMSPGEADAIASGQQDEAGSALAAAVRACRQGVARTHLISRHTDGALLMELFTRNGCGSMVSAELYEITRQAEAEDIPGILELLEPLESAGILVRRSRERLEAELDCFTIMERDGMIVACAALYEYADEHAAELACLAVHPGYQKQGRGDTLLQYMEDKALDNQLTQLFVLTTQTAHWFLERGFAPCETSSLPIKKQELYNYQRNSKSFVKKLVKGRRN